MAFVIIVTVLNTIRIPLVIPYEALEGLDRKTMAELIVMAEEAVADTPLEELEWYQEKYILDYFAEAGLFMKHGLDVWAEIYSKPTHQASSRVS